MIRRYAFFVALWSIFFAQASVLLAAGPSQGDAARLYHDYCSVCHGDKGDGKSRAAKSLRPPPRDFTSPRAAVELTHQRMIHSIREGRRGTSMVPWKHQLTNPQIKVLAEFIRKRFMAPTAFDTSNEGRRIYAKYCSVCHGEKGNGMSRASRSLIPPPRNFKNARARRELTRKRMIFSVTYGRANTAMAPWRTQLKKKQIEAVVNFIRAVFMNQGRGNHIASGKDHKNRQAKRRDSVNDHNDGRHQHGTPGPNLSAFFAKPFLKGLVGNRENGKRLYIANCRVCHGKKGDGKGPRAYFILPKPRDFRHPAARASLNRPHLYKAISKGSLGSVMPAWEKVMSPHEIADISEYVFKAFIQTSQKVKNRAGHSRGKSRRRKPRH